MFCVLGVRGRCLGATERGLVFLEVRLKCMYSGPGLRDCGLGFEFRILSFGFGV